MVAWVKSWDIMGADRVVSVGWFSGVMSLSLEDEYLIIKVGWYTMEEAFKQINSNKKTSDETAALNLQELLEILKLQAQLF